MGVEGARRTPDGAAASLTRRRLLQAAGTAGLAVAAGPVLWRQPAIAGTGGPEQVHLQFGGDAAREMTVSWVTPGSVANPRVRVGTAAGGAGTTLPAVTRTYTDSLSGVEVVTQHVPLVGLAPDTDHVYAVVHDGATPYAGTFRTGPAGRAAFRFTSFGDQTTGDVTDPIGTPYASYVVDQVERQQPLFHLLNGDLCYANLGQYAGRPDTYAPRQEIWGRFFANNQRSAANRPWMPAAGNHENEVGNGPQGFASYLTRFFLPDNGSADFRGNWYAFTAGAVRVVVLQNDDVCYQDGGNFYVRGYSGDAQRAWLEGTLAAARTDPGIDWVVVCMHQLALSSANGNGSDLGVREEFLPLFDAYGVDLVLCGHDHDYERSHPVRGVEAGSATRQPSISTSDAGGVVDATRGTVHLTLGGGGTALPTNTYLGDVPGAPMATVVTGRSTTTREPAAWSAVRDPAYPYGFATIDVDPGTAPGGLTRLLVTYYRTPPSSSAAPVVFDRIALQRPRSDAGPGAAVPEAARAVVLPAVAGLGLAAYAAARSRAAPRGSL